MRSEAAICVLDVSGIGCHYRDNIEYKELAGELVVRILRERRGRKRQQSNAGASRGAGRSPRRCGLQEQHHARIRFHHAVLLVHLRFGVDAFTARRKRHNACPA